MDPRRGLDMSEHYDLDRREFLRTSVLATTALAAGATLGGGGGAARAAAGKLPTRPFGKTGYQVGIYSLGGQALLERAGNRDKALEIINHALDLGLNYIDTAAAYGNGVSETYLGEALKTRRAEVFLATKTHDRGYDGSMRYLERSLKNLQTDHLDLWQIHNVTNLHDIDAAFSARGVIKAMEKARDEKLVRFVGITGHHDPEPLLAGINRYPFDTILMALNAAEVHNRSFQEKLLPRAIEKQMGIIGMKIPARGAIFNPQGITKMDVALRYVLSLGVSTTIVGISKPSELDENVRTALAFKPYTKEELAAVEALTKPYYQHPTYFRKR